jgi:hypothetical protein
MHEKWEAWAEFVAGSLSYIYIYIPFNISHSVGIEQPLSSCRRQLWILFPDQLVVLYLVREMRQLRVETCQTRPRNRPIKEQKRPTDTCIPDLCISVKRDLLYRQKRPSILAKETCLSRKRTYSTLRSNWSSTSNISPRNRHAYISGGRIELLS